MLNAGELDIRITFQKRQVTGQDSFGQPEFTWVDHTRVWAKRKDIRGRETLLAQAHTATFQAEYIVRYMVGLDETMRIVDAGVYYDIQNISRMGRKEGLIILAKVPGQEVA